MIQKTKKIIITGSISNKFRYILLVLLFITATANGFAQENDPYGFSELNSLFKAHDHEVLKYTNKGTKPKNELEFLLAAGFNTYKAFFSSQDNPSCVFYPSCSSYSVQAFQQKGFIVGTFRTFDRLSRCHRLVKTGEYYFDPEKERYYDPVK